MLARVVTQVLGNGHVDPDEVVAAGVARPVPGRAVAGESEQSLRLSAGGDLEIDRSVESVDGDGGSEDGLPDVDGEVGVDVDPVAPPLGVRIDVDGDIEVAAGLSVGSELALPRNAKARALLDAVGMIDQKKKFPSQISGGQKQRVAVARALVGDPKLVLADEPTANLDHDTAFMVIDLMKWMKEERKATFIFSTHDPKIVGEAEIIYTLEDGLLTGREDRRTGHA